MGAYLEGLILSMCDFGCYLQRNPYTTIFTTDYGDK